MESYGMQRWESRVVLVTGAGAGIGAATTESLVKHGMIVIGCSRNISPIEKLREQCKKAEYKGKLHPYQCDLSKDSEIQTMFSWIESTLGGVDVCINNAGFAAQTTLLEIQPAEMRDMLDVNVIAPVQCAQATIKSMIRRGVDDGHILNINSVLGHYVLGSFNFYASTKWAITALTQGFRKELSEKGSRIKVTSISPGRTETQFLYRALGDAEKAGSIYSKLENLTAQDVTNSVLHALATPPHVQVHEILLEPIQPTPKGTYEAK